MDRRGFFARSLSGGAALAAAPLARARATRSPRPEALGLLYDSTLCIGCKACVAACKRENDMLADHAPGVEKMWDTPLDLSGRTLNVIKVYREGGAREKDVEKDGYAFIKKSCMHCVDPSCVSACPVSAMTKDRVSGIVRYSEEACIGCRYCVAACPFGVPRFTFDRAYPKISKCQLCQHRLGEGKFAACAEVCPTGATLYGPVADLKQEITRRRALPPGTRTTFPRGRIGSGDTYVGTVARYVDHVYGEKEIGGTQVIHLSGVPFELLNKPQLPDIAPASISESVQHAIYYNLIAPVGFLGVLAGLAFRHMQPAPEPAAGPQAKGDGGES